MTELKAKIALITGASAGIGAATAKAFARAGVRTILVARRAERLEQLSNELLQTYEAESIPLALDLRDGDQVESGLNSLPLEWHAVEILVNNAGLARGMEPFYLISPSQTDEVIDVNIKGLLNVSRVVVAWMLKRGCGHIINLGSIAGYETYPGGAVYCASKFAVRALTMGMKMDLQGTPLRVTSIDPGLVETEFSQVRFDGDLEAAQKPYQGITPLSGDDIAEAIVWAASRPAHVNVMNMTLFPTAQASALLVHRG